MTSLSPAQLETLVRIAAQTRPDEMGCGECYERLDRFAETTLAGLDAEAASPLVAEHLAMCHECLEEFEALLAGLRAVGR